MHTNSKTPKSQVQEFAIANEAERIKQKIKIHKCEVHLRKNRTHTHTLTKSYINKTLSDTFRPTPIRMWWVWYTVQGEISINGTSLDTCRWTTWMLVVSQNVSIATFWYPKAHSLDLLLKNGTNFLLIVICFRFTYKYVLKKHMDIHLLSLKARKFMHNYGHRNGLKQFNCSNHVCFLKYLKETTCTLLRK